MKGKGKKERYTHLNAEFQRIARRDKKAFFRDQCIVTDKHNRRGKARGLNWKREWRILPKDGPKTDESGRDQ